jgi:protease IV
MTLDADRLAERRRLKRRLSFWRIGAILGVVAVVIAVATSREGGVSSYFGAQQHVARVEIAGVITDDRNQRKLLADLEKSDQVRAVILQINSPGGTTSGAEGLYLAVRKLADKKPVVAVFGTIATSAAYLTGIAADHIVARGNSITGSVGVIMQYAEVSELLNKLGVQIEEIRSGPLKAVPSPFKPTDPEGRALAEEMVNESRDWFVGLVAERRPGATPSIDQIRTGRIYTGRQAVQIGLVDRIGDEDTARDWMEGKGVPKSLTVVDWKPKDTSSFSVFGSLSGAITQAILGVTAELHRFVIEAVGRVNYLDGLVSLWHPQNNK